MISGVVFGSCTLLDIKEKDTYSEKLKKIEKRLIDGNRKRENLNKH